MKNIIKYVSSILFTVLLLFSVFKIVRVDAVDVPFKITNIEVKDKSSGVIINDVSINSGTITNDIVFSNKDDYIKYNVTFKNDSEKDYIIKSISDDNDSSNLEYTYDDLSNVKIEAGKEKTFELTLTYKLESSSVNISNKKVNLFLTYEDDEGNTFTDSLSNNGENDETITNPDDTNDETITNPNNGQSNQNETTKEDNKTNIINVPKTGDNLTKYIILLVISIIGLVITLINKKRLKKSLMVIVLTLLFIPIGIKADEAVFQIVFNNKITAYEFNVSFNTNEGSNINPLKIISGGKVTKPSDPEKENNVFIGWYKDSDYINEFDFENDTISKDTVIYAKWLNGNIVKYNANGGKFTNGKTIKPIEYEITTGDVTKYSYTENIDITGKQNSNYGEDWYSFNILGSDRGDPEEPHVVTIPGAESLVVDVYFNSEDTDYDYALILEGNHKYYYNYTYEESEQITYYILGGEQTGTYTVNDNELTNMGHETILIQGDSVTFDFVSDNDDCGAGYGYYAIIKGTGKDIQEKGTYEEPINGNAIFAGWYKDSDTTDGQEFDEDDIDGIVEVYAKWLYQIVYIMNGGNLNDFDEYIKAGDSLENLPEPTKFQSTFLGWFDELNEKIEDGFIPTDNMELVANWETNKYTITFDSKGGSSVDSITKEYDTEIGELPTPTKANYVFEGWYVDDTYETKITEDTLVLEDTTYVARWVPVYNITYNANGGKFSNNNSTNVIKYALDIKNVEKISRTQNVDSTGKKISNYGNNKNGNYIVGSDRGYTSNHVITVPGAESLNVDIYYNGEDATKDFATIWEGSYPNYAASAYFRTGITGGQQLGGVQTGNYTLNGNSLTNMGHSHFTINGESVTFGFKSDSSGYGQGYGYYAIVTTVLNNSYFIDTYTEPTSLGKTFIGWYKDANCTAGQEFKLEDLDSDIEVYAKWAYKVTFDPTGGTVTPTYKNLTTGASVGTLPTPTRNLYAFNGWFTEAEGGEQITASYVPTSNVTVYAQWTKLPTWVISFETFGGSDVADIEILRGGTLGTLPTPTHEHFLFMGWYTDSSYTTKISSTTIPDGNKTYYAKWHEYDADPSNINITVFDEYVCPNNMNITVSDNIVCKRAEALHQEVCNSSGGASFCAGYNGGQHEHNSIITYGNCGTRGELKGGDAFTCDVNGDGKFNELTERFYYLSDYYNTTTREYESDTAALIYYNSVTNGLATNTVPHAYSANGLIANGPVTAVVQLPKTSQWTNVSLKNTSRQLILDDSRYGSENLPVFDYTGYAARFPQFGELEKACGKTNSQLTQLNGIRTYMNCEYLFENTLYTTYQTEPDGSWNPDAYYAKIVRGHYVENIAGPSSSANSVRILNSSDLGTGTNTNPAGLYYGVRPVIEISKERIDY